MKRCFELRFIVLRKFQPGIKSGEKRKKLPKSFEIEIEVTKRVKVEFFWLQAEWPSLTNGVQRTRVRIPSQRYCFGSEKSIQSRV